MKTISKLLLMTLVLAVSSYQYASAATATVTMTFTQGSGTPASGQQVTCYITPPKTTAYPPTPQYSYLTANASGVATWQPTFVEGATEYKCYHRTALTPDGCYAWGTDASTGAMLLADGQSQSYSFAATTPSASTCTTSSTGSQTTTQPSPTTQSTTPTTTTAAITAVAPVVTFAIDGKPAGDKAIEVTKGQSFVVSGKTTARGEVIVIVYSDTIETKVTADADGAWKFDVLSLKDLPVGKHEVRVALVDAAGKRSEQTSPIEFTLKAAAQPAQASPASQPDKTSQSIWPSMIKGVIYVLAVAMIGSGVFLVVKGIRIRKRSSHVSPSASEDIATSRETTPQATEHSDR